IELGEVESQLRKHPEVQDAVVVARKEAHAAALCAYVVKAGKWEVTSLRNHLAKVLPEYMLPSYWVRMEKLPLTVNGKVDRKALPAPTGRIDSNQYEAPRTATEKALATIWKEILALEKIGRTSHFFACGGHSLKAISLMSRIQKVLEVEVPIR